MGKIYRNAEYVVVVCKKVSSFPNYVPKDYDVYARSYLKERASHDLNQIWPWFKNVKRVSPVKRRPPPSGLFDWACATPNKPVSHSHESFRTATKLTVREDFGFRKIFKEKVFYALPQQSSPSFR